MSENNNKRPADLGVVLYRGQLEGLDEAYDRIEKELIPLLEGNPDAVKIVEQFLYEWGPCTQKKLSADEMWWWWRCPRCKKVWHDTWDKASPETDVAPRCDCVKDERGFLFLEMERVPHDALPWTQPEAELTALDDQNTLNKIRTLLLGEPPR